MTIHVDAVAVPAKVAMPAETCPLKGPTTLSLPWQAAERAPRSSLAEVIDDTLYDAPVLEVKVAHVSFSPTRSS